MTFAGMGIELAGTTLGVAAIGYVVDWYLAAARPYGFASGALVGFAFGMFRFIQRALHESQR